MRVADTNEALAVHDLYQAITDVVINVPLERHVVVSVLLKITASLALAEEWDQDELLQAFAYTYDMEKFLNPTSQERH